jgi:hypothetical protein
MLRVVEEVTSFCMEVLVRMSTATVVNISTRKTRLDWKALAMARVTRPARLVRT